MLKSVVERVDDFALLSDPSLRLYLPFWKRDGPYIQSDDGHGHTATVTGALWSIQGRRFDGVDDVIIVPSCPGLQLVNEFSIEMWLKFKAVGAAVGLLAKGNSNTLSGNSYYIRKTAGDAIGFTIGTGAANEGITSATAISINMWYHIIAVAWTTRYELYINGVSANTAVARTINPFVGTQSVYIGATDAAVSNPLNGFIGGLLIYNRGLPRAEVQQLYSLTRWRYK
jgi:hypothetical protein